MGSGVGRDDGPKVGMLEIGLWDGGGEGDAVAALASALSRLGEADAVIDTVLLSSFAALSTPSSMGYDGGYIWTLMEEANANTPTLRGVKT